MTAEPLTEQLLELGQLMAAYRRDVTTDREFRRWCDLVAHVHTLHEAQERCYGRLARALVDLTASAQRYENAPVDDFAEKCDLLDEIDTLLENHQLLTDADRRRREHARRRAAATADCRSARTVRRVPLGV